MTKPREKTREELTAEIEEGKKKIRQFENREKIIKQKLSVEERKARNHRLCKRGGFMESLVPELIAMPDEDAKAFLRLDERASTGVFEKTSRGRECGVIPLEQRAHLYTLAGVCALPRAHLRTGNFPRAPIWRLCRNKGLHPLRRLRGYPCTPTKTVHPPLVSVPFLRVLLSYPGGDTHSHLSL
jgi:hypothetical protein